MSSPPVLLLCRLFPGTFTDVAHRFRLLDFYASALPIHAFLAAVAAHADPPRVVLVFGGGPIPVGAELFDAVPSLRCIITVSAGTNHIDLRECARRGVQVANAGGIYSTDVADYAVGLLLDVLRHVSAGDRFVRRGLCPEQRGGDFLPLGSKIGGRRVGIIGLGSIGSAIARRLEAFGCVVSYHNRRRREDVAYAYFPTATDLAASSDVLVVACALTAETRRIVDRGVLDALGERGVVVNVARGANVDEAELVRALAEGRVAGAGLEVFDDEPNVPLELWAMDNVVLTPHQAIFTPESMADLSRVVLANLDAFFAGEPLLTRVEASERSKGYRFLRIDYSARFLPPLSTLNPKALSLRLPARRLPVASSAAPSGAATSAMEHRRFLQRYGLNPDDFDDDAEAEPMEERRRGRPSPWRRLGLAAATQSPPLARTSASLSPAPRPPVLPLPLHQVKHRGGIPNPLPDCVPAVYDAIESVFQKTIDHSLTWCW
uniref:D-isomer specific 2-hydroxyacid dehydrogenase NAD-binding domain-containing protein n=1 Tax=Oryza meridionalis TaxID=40149 RepID=A0A0E0D9Z0_9ORYZ